MRVLREHSAVRTREHWKPIHLQKPGWVINLWVTCINNNKYIHTSLVQTVSPWLCVWDRGWTWLVGSAFLLDHSVSQNLSLLFWVLTTDGPTVAVTWPRPSPHHSCVHCMPHTHTHAHTCARARANRHHVKPEHNQLSDSDGLMHIVNFKQVENKNIPCQAVLLFTKKIGWDNDG